MMARKLCLTLLLSHLSIVLADESISVDILKRLPFSEQEKQKILQGELVTTQVKESKEHELAVLLAFVVKTTPADVKKHFIQGTWIDLPEPVLKHHKLSSNSTKKDFAELRFSADETDEINRFLAAKAGNDLNLSADEIQRFQKINDTQTTVEEQLDALLHERFKAYLTGGAKTIPPYQREDGKQFSLGQYFQSVTRFDSVLQEYYPKFYQALMNYPVSKPAQLEEAFFGLKLEVEGRPTFTLMHRMLLEEGDAVAVSLRQFYVTQSYNGEQNLGLFIPIKDGVLVLGLFRTSSDAVAGFGSGVKHSIGRKLLANNLIKYYQQVQKLIK